VYIAADMTATVLAVGGATAGLPADGIDLRDMVANPSSYTARQLLHYKGVSNNFLDGSFFSPRGNGISTLTRKLYRYDLSSFPAGTTPLATDEYEAYDLDVDPNEWNNWANDPTRRTERDTLEAALNALLAS
jgi:hypothetical protein